MATLLAVNGIEHTTPEFQRGVIDMTGRIGGNPDYWLAVMSFETAGTFSPAIRNKHSKAVGLIQFTKGTADRLGTTRDALAKLTAVEQLVWVEKYLAPWTGRYETIQDHYLSVFAPIGVGKDLDYVLYRADAPTEKQRKRYFQNEKLDKNPRDGTITVAEAIDPVTQIVENATGRIEVPDPFGPAPAGEAAAATSGVLALMLFILGIKKFKKLGRNS